MRNDIWSLTKTKRRKYKVWSKSFPIIPTTPNLPIRLPKPSKSIRPYKAPLKWPRSSYVKPDPSPLTVEEILLLSALGHPIPARYLVRR